ncbi:MAG: hypothetical protein R3F62_24480 [Planctomycetota bacterium]
MALDLLLRSHPTHADLCRLVVQHVERLPDRRELTLDVLQALAAWALEV